MDTNCCADCHEAPAEPRSTTISRVPYRTARQLCDPCWAEELEAAKAELTELELECRDCGEREDVDDQWETLEDIPLCCDCASTRIEDRGPGGVPQEWLIED